MYFEYACKNLAGDIENGRDEETLLASIVPALEYARENKVTHILYACTHYPLVHDTFLKAQEIVSFGGEFIDPSLYIGEAVKSWQLGGDKTLTCYTSKDTEVFSRISKEFE